MHENTPEITDLILDAADKARRETDSEPEPEVTTQVNWPVQCTVGPGLEGAIACTSKVGYVNGTKGWLIYRGYDIFDLCAHSCFEEVSYLLLHGKLPTGAELESYKQKLFDYSNIVSVKRMLLGFPVEDMNTMAALRLGTLLMRQKQTYRDRNIAAMEANHEVLSSDEDSIPMETEPSGSHSAVYEFSRKTYRRPPGVESELRGSEGFESCYHLIAGLNTITGAVARIREGRMPLEPDPELSHAGNLLYLMTGRRPTPVEERIMDVALILHADHGMNASTFAAMVVASTLSDIYFSVGSGIAALSGPLHGGANEKVLHMLAEIAGPAEVDGWYEQQREKKRKIMGFGHRVYKAYDPRARVLGPLAEHLAKTNPEVEHLFGVAKRLETKVVQTLGEEKKIFPNVDFYSGIVYSSMGIPVELFTPIFAVSRVAGWTARVLEYLENNRIFRPRGVYVGEFDKKYVPVDERG